MPPAKKAAGDDAGPPKGLTESELRFIKAVFDNMIQKPDANWEGVAADLGLKDAKCAKERFRQMSMRHGWRDRPSTSATASPRKRSNPAAHSGRDEDKPKKPRLSRKAASKHGPPTNKQVNEYFDDDDDNGDDDGGADMY
ncbi:hypothetical protein CDD83_7952 [Cordyceps sp. RAO-2017]|nr:hypothetical protein CDD83_7952 [Cordyceps sp. RAO-2017]